jgi:uncharacterized membrane protein
MVRKAQGRNITKVRQALLEIRLALDFCLALVLVMSLSSSFTLHKENIIVTEIGLLLHSHLCLYLGNAIMPLPSSLTQLLQHPSPFATKEKN